MLVRFLADELAGPYADLLRRPPTANGWTSRTGRRRCTCCTATSTAAPCGSRGSGSGDSTAARAPLSMAPTSPCGPGGLQHHDVAERPALGQQQPGHLPVPDRPARPRVRRSYGRRARFRTARTRTNTTRASWPVPAADPRAGLRNLVRMHLSELFDGSWDGIDEFPELPADHLATFLGDDLIDLGRDGCRRPHRVRRPAADDLAT